MAQTASPPRAWIRTILFLLLAPGVIAGVIPWLISGWRWGDWGGLAWVVVPIAWIQALLCGSWWLVLYAIIVLTTVVGFVKATRSRPSPRTYGEQYLSYRRHGPWRSPLLKPWRE